MRSREFFGVLCLAVALTGCVRQVKMTSQFNPAEASFINNKGKARIEGQLFLRRNDGVVVYGAGTEVTLIPQSTYADERIITLYQGNKMLRAPILTRIEDTDPAYLQYQRHVKANGEGRFVFDEVPAGSYYITGAVTWCAPSQYGCITQGGGLLERVTVRGSEKQEIIMNGM